MIEESDDAPDISRDINSTGENISSNTYTEQSDQVLWTSAFTLASLAGDNHRPEGIDAQNVTLVTTETTSTNELVEQNHSSNNNLLVNMELGSPNLIPNAEQLLSSHSVETSATSGNSVQALVQQVRISAQSNASTTTTSPLSFNDSHGTEES